MYRWQIRDVYRLVPGEDRPVDISLAEVQLATRQHEKINEITCHFGHFADL
jgi:hypothetical protein